MSLSIVCFFFALASVVLGAPLTDCSLQADCVHFFFEGGDANGCGGDTRTVCMSWSETDNCVKASNDTVSHSCVAPGGLKTDSWASGDDARICQTNSSSISQVTFGFKDGKADTCGSSSVSLWGQTSTCGSIGNHCYGGQKTECLWTINLPVCSSSTGQTSGGNSDDNWTGPCASLTGSNVNSDICKCKPNDDKCDCSCKCC
eukprot:TRINITY_DN1257_c0_g1_i1.p1 TRINITY_DN1257_c0_g1~~TRINITY_DN1257_c0_g1_i1.p1  ORF type:complete len:219 (-),score=38.74 TRINITY_DN1257_c0_g1_i1:86-691(-)